MVIDATERPVAKSELVSRALRREEVIGQPLAETVFAIADAALFKDERLKELLV